MAVWTIRGGRAGEYEHTFLEKGVVSVGFGLDRSITEFTDREALRAHLGQDQNRANQLWRFYQDVEIGDMVVLPRKVNREVAVGRITGAYSHQPDSVGTEAPHVRTVDWQATNIPRAHFDRDLLNSFGSLLTISQPRAPDAEARIARVANAFLGDDQFEEPSIPPIVSWESSEDHLLDGGSFEGIDIDQEIRDRIVARLKQKFAGTRLEDLVASILHASGYFVLQTRKGADGGIDVLAGKGDMGFGEPRLCVQVKGRNSTVDLVEYDRLQGNIASFRAQHGLLVSLGGFTKPVHDRNEQSFFVIRLWGPEELAQQLLDNYDSLPQDIRADIPLETVRILRESE